RLVGFRNRYPANLDLSAAPDAFDWDSIRPQQGDDPNILILHIYNVWRAGAADDDYIRGHYGFMRRNLTSQFDAECRLPFHGDETYQVYVMMQTGAPMSDFYSVDTNFWHVAASEAMSEMAATLGLDEDARTFASRAAACRALTDAHYWNDAEGYYTPFVKKDSLSPADSPFGDINFNALWMGYGAPSDEKLRRNALAAAKKLMNKTGGVKTSSRVSTFTGMLPGYLLYNLKALGLTPQADLAFDSLFNGSMSSTGEFAEAYGANNRWMDYTTHPNVLRPWETAINAEAVLYYLTGFRYDHRSKRATLSPSLPPGVGFVAVENLRAGQNRLSVYITAKNDGQLEVEARATGEPGFAVEMSPTNQD
ncbi:MAG TPA: trehalase family glycosidase, partial [bacterium]|nr:trehalase family glycosidase [bacterium]